MNAQRYDPITWIQRGRRVIRRHRRLLAAGLAASAVMAAVAAVSPDQPETATVLAAAGDLRGGTMLTAQDVRAVAVPVTVTPAGAFRPGEQVAGRLLAAPLRRGEILTDVRLVGPTLLDGYRSPGSELVATPVRIADAGAVNLLSPGARIDVLAAGAQDMGGDATARVVAAGVRVLAVPRPADDAEATGFSSLNSSPIAAPLGEGVLVVLATTPDVASQLAQATVNSRLSVTLRGEE